MIMKGLIGMDAVLLVVSVIIEAQTGQRAGERLGNKLQAVRWALPTDQR